MAKHKKDPLLEALKEGKSYTWTLPDGGDLASMRAAVKHGQTLTVSPIGDPSEIQAGDMVFVRWKQTTFIHVVGEIRDGQYLIVNSLGKVNGWLPATDILGRVTKVVEPEPRPSVDRMLEQLEAAYQAIITQEKPSENEAHQFNTIVSDLRWYAGRIGPERWDAMPRSNKWSFQQNLWRLTKQAKTGTAPVPNRVLYFIDLGKQCVGAAGEIYSLFEYDKIEEQPTGQMT